MEQVEGIRNFLITRLTTEFQRQGLAGLGTIAAELLPAVGNADGVGAIAEEVKTR